MQLEIDGLEILSDDECLARLASTKIGRVAVSVGALPAVLPVNYGMLGDLIVFFTGPGTKLRFAMSNAVVAFEVDDFDDRTESGWSVMCIGRAFEVTDPGILAAARRKGIRPWADGDRSHLVALQSDFLSGRRIRRHPGPDGAA